MEAVVVEGLHGKRDRTDGILMPHQAEGLRWLVKEKKGLLAWEPGIGKTVVTLRAVDKLGCRNVLILCPKSVVSVWYDEAVKWGVEVPQIVRGVKMRRERFYAQGGHKRLVMGYETARSDFKALQKVSWNAIVWDETVKVQNPRAKVTKCAKALWAPVRIALNGTPISNGYGDIWATMEWLDPGCLYGNFYIFRNMHAIMPIPGIPAIKGWRGVEEIKNRTGHLIHWKKKMEVLEDLPPVTEEPIRFELSPRERKVYDKIKEELAVEILGQEVSIPNAVVALVRLRQATNGLFAFGKEKDMSSKFEALMELLETMPAGRQVLVFSCFKQTIDELACEWLHHGARITGDTPTTERERIVKDFMAGKIQILLGTDAMSTGLNLQAASYVINLDLPWSFARYEQRIGRAWRMGQKNPVTVYNLEAEDTVDEDVRGILGRKLTMAGEFGGVTMEDIKRILT